jgi:hypothetical protein
MCGGGCGREWSAEGGLDDALGAFEEALGEV